MSATAMYNTADDLNPPKTVENDDGSLSAPIMYASVVMGMITMWAERGNDAKQASGGEGSGDEVVLHGAKATRKDRTAWTERVSVGRTPAKSEPQMALSPMSLFAEISRCSEVC